MLRRAFLSVVFLLVLCNTLLKAQCPLNIGFDNGDFTNWEGATGTIDRANGVITMTSVGLVAGRHTIISRAAKQTDPYGNFPIASPNGSKYVVMLGNSSTNREAERLSYTIKVPTNVNNYSLIYYYAVVFQNPGHLDWEQPKFTANVYDVAKGQYAGCGTYEFVASGSLPGFQNSTNGVVYKSWSPVTINLAGYAGKTLRLEFTTNDCSRGGHFGYAYIDVNQNCTSPVNGNVVCANNNYVQLAAPTGFLEYHWYLGNNYTKELGTSNTLRLSPAPAIGTQYSVRLVPYPGIGCEDTIVTTIQSPENLPLVVKPNVAFCRNEPVDLTDPSIVDGTDPSFTFTYHTDAQGINFIDDPQNVTDSGTYYLKATSPAGCEYIKPVKISFILTPTLVITNPPEVCTPATVDITRPYIIAGSKNIPNITYWTDENCTISLTNPTQISKSGTYYLKSTNSLGCYDAKPVNVLINNLPELKTFPVVGCNTADITTTAATIYKDPALRYTYWTNAECTDTLFKPSAVTKSGTYYIKVYTQAGCYVSAPIKVSVYDYPVSTITDPPSVIFPETIDITHAFTRQTGTAYYFYSDSAATHLLPDPTHISIRGTYYIKAVNGNDCSIMYTVYANIQPPAVVDYGVNTFTPNGDGKNETFRLNITKSVKLNYFRIYNSWGALLFETSNYLQAWDGTNNGQKMPVGTYYWIMDGYDTYTKQSIKKTGSVTIVL